MKDNPDGALKLYTYNQYHDLVDSLPFVDSIPKEMDSTIKQLIQDEMKSMLEESGGDEDALLKTYLAPLPFTACTRESGDHLYNMLIDGIKNGIEMEKLDLDRYASSNFKNITEKLCNSKMLLEYSNGSIINLELMDRYKEPIWLKYLDDLTLLKMRLEKSKNDLEQQIEQVNKSRKLQHVECASRIRSIHGEYLEYQNKNRQLLHALEMQSLVKDDTLVE
ncbi:Pre-mRNA-splicing factor SPF27 [Babesia duncani]|uniref:Pre-mRNA-splicing factor SPF27 n=1 Tax=Babesia duncani TaxID=323732 RepID=A0AAD9PIH9_9APIC|nr:Pre-mRNA-splicing factor SPF27 [Babesia duncani]